MKPQLKTKLTGLTLLIVIVTGLGTSIEVKQVNLETNQYEECYNGIEENCFNSTWLDVETVVDSENSYIKSNPEVKTAINNSYYNTSSMELVNGSRYNIGTYRTVKHVNLSGNKGLFNSQVNARTTEGKTDTATVTYKYYSSIDVKNKYIASKESSKGLRGYVNWFIVIGFIATLIYFIITD